MKKILPKVRKAFVVWLILAVSIYIFDLVLFQVQLKQSGSPVCNAAMEKPSFLSAKVSNSEVSSEDWVLGSPINQIFLPWEADRAFPSTRSFEPQHFETGSRAASYKALVSDRCQYLRLVTIKNIQTLETEEQRAETLDRVRRFYFDDLFLDPKQPEMNNLLPVEEQNWRSRGFQNFRFFEIVTKDNGLSVGGISCGSIPAWSENPRQGAFEGARFSADGSLIYSRAWLAEDRVNAELLTAKLCSFMVYTRYSAIWTFRPSYLSRSNSMPLDDTWFAQAVWGYDMFQLALNLKLKSVFTSAGE